jgi:hypothetical protein
MYFQINDCDGESLGIVRVTNMDELDESIIGDSDMDNHITKSFEKFQDTIQDVDNLLDDIINPYDLDEFSDFHNKNNKSQIERIYINIIQP